MTPRSGQLWPVMPMIPTSIGSKLQGNSVALVLVARSGGDGSDLPVPASPPRNSRSTSVGSYSSMHSSALAMV
jgi:hypothetical protein